LEKVTELRQEQFKYFIYILPAAGVLVGLIYYFGDDKKKRTSKGNNAILEQIYCEDPRKEQSIPSRMLLMVFAGTIITHTFGGSAGREGTAIQMAASIASSYYKLIQFFNIQLSSHTVRTLLIASIAAGFGGVFGVPITGAVFALEVLSIGRVGYEAAIPCLIASILSDWSCRFILGLLNSGHTNYHPLTPSFSIEPITYVGTNWILVGQTLVTGIFCGVASALFTVFMEKLIQFFKFALKIFFWLETTKIPYLRSLFGGAIIIGLNFLFPDSYLGIGTGPPGFNCSQGSNIVTLSSAFCKGGARPYSWLLKLIFTSVTLSSGFKGGEVTPLFFIGATLGNACGEMFGSDRIDLFAAIGFVGVFSGATNTPLACTLMGIELFGGAHTVYIAICCFAAYLSSGFTSIYESQAVSTDSKIDAKEDFNGTIKDAGEDFDGILQVYSVFMKKVKDWFGLKQSFASKRLSSVLHSSTIKNQYERVDSNNENSNNLVLNS